MVGSTLYSPHRRCLHNNCAFSFKKSTKESLVKIRTIKGRKWVQIGLEECSHEPADIATILLSTNASSLSLA